MTMTKQTAVVNAILTALMGTLARDGTSVSLGLMTLSMASEGMSKGEIATAIVTAGKLYALHHHAEIDTNAVNEVSQAMHSEFQASKEKAEVAVDPPDEWDPNSEKCKSCPGYDECLEIAKRSAN